MEPGLYDISEAAYHADPCDTPSLSSSIARILVTQTPLHAWAAHPKLGNIPRKPSKEMDIGSAVHRLLLGKGTGIEIIPGIDDFRTKAAQAARDAAREAGRIPMTEAQYDSLASVADILRSRVADQGVDLGRGQPEATLIWDELGQHGPVRCRRKVDLIDLDIATIIEVKTISSADPGTAMRRGEDDGWGISMAATCSAVGKLYPELAGRLVYKHVLLEKQESRGKEIFKPPYIVAVREHDGIFEELGVRRWSRAVPLWEKCLRTDIWPGYGHEPISAPLWAVQDEESL